MSCKLCNRKFGSTLNPMVKDPEKDDLLKQRGSLAQCSPCFFYIKSDPKLKDMNRTDLMQKMANDQSFKMEFMNGLSAWEADRREGKRKNVVTAPSQCQLRPNVESAPSRSRATFGRVICWTSTTLATSAKRAS